MRFGSITTDIIADGLIFNVDAANRASYPVQRTLSTSESGSCFNTLDLPQSGSFISDPTFITQPISASCWGFDGVDDYIDCGASTLSGETALSISAWVYPTSYGGAAAESFVSTDSTSPRGFYIGVYNATNFRFAFTTNGANLTSINTAGGTVDLNVWQHILVTWDQVNLKLYKNGVLLNTVPTTFASNGTFTTTNNLLIGVRQLGGVGPFEGNIANVQIYNTSLSSTEVLHNYNALKSRFGL